MKVAKSAELTRRLLTALVPLLLACSSAHADRVFWGCGFKPTTLCAGPLTCRQEVACHKMSLSCEQASKPLFVVDAFADHIAVPDHGRYVIGLSNRGSTPLFWLRGFNGELIGLTPGSKIHFCTESVTNVREWFDEKDPDVRFWFEGDRPARVIVRGCDGHDVSLNVDNTR